MENASKALTIAGSMLVSIIVVSMLVMFFNNLRNVAGTEQAIEGELAAAEFNKQFDVYARNVYGTELFSLANKVKDYNLKTKADGYELVDLIVTITGNLDDNLLQPKYKNKLKYQSNIFQGGTYGITSDPKLKNSVKDLNVEFSRFEENFKEVKKKEFVLSGPVSIRRTVEQLANMRTNEREDLGFKDPNKGGKLTATSYSEMNEYIDLYYYLKSDLTKIKEVNFEYKDAKYSDGTGRIIKMSFARSF